MKGPRRMDGKLKSGIAVVSVEVERVEIGCVEVTSR